MKDFKDLKKRLFISFFAILLVASLVTFSSYLFVKFLVVIVICAIASIATLEFIEISKKKDIILSKNLLLTSSVFLVISFFILSMYQTLNVLPVLVFLIFFIFLFFNEFKKIEGSISRIAYSIFALIFISVPIGMILPILFMDYFEIQDGRYWVLYILLVTKVTDIGAYFGGRLFGRKKLHKKVSPKKTIIGSISGIIIAVITSVLLSFLHEKDVFDISLFQSIFLALILAVFSQFGDLSESLLKRDAKIKDSNALPAIGGVFDMIDSLIFNIPIMYLFLIG
ncbi:MAG: Phosphatidate cytidylyltransferase [Candidatus Anoxychlamydiales bacterium]|nr:Phosphatidate cytidylyltransferase [Candidatus Anoxychlamydiales bacterium]